MILAPQSCDTGSARRKWVNTDPDLRCTDGRLYDLIDYWSDRRGGRLLPARADINPIDLPKLIGSLMLLDVEQNPLRLRYRLIGTTITTMMDRDSTGRYYDEMYEPDLLEAVYESFRWIIAERRPLRAHGDAFYPDKNCYWYEIVNLPLAADGETVDMMLCGLLFHGTDGPCAPHRLL